MPHFQVDSNIYCMKPLISILFFSLACFLYGGVYIIYRRQQAKIKVVPVDEPMLDDVSYIREIKRQPFIWAQVTWQQYDILLAARPYWWEAMVDWAAYMETADIESIESLIVSAPGEEDTELAQEYNQNKVGLKNFDRLTKEMGSLSIAGHSRSLNDHVKIVWYNQTNVLRVFTHISDETLVTKYVETFIRRTFGTPDAMKLAKSVPQDPVSARTTIFYIVSTLLGNRQHARLRRS